MWHVKGVISLSVVLNIPGLSTVSLQLQGLEPTLRRYLLKSLSHTLSASFDQAFLEGLRTGSEKQDKVPALTELLAPQRARVTPFMNEDASGTTRAIKIKQGDG